jgi:protein gp37
MVEKGTLLGDGQPYKTGLTYDDMYLDRKKLAQLGRNTRKPASVFLCSMTDWAATGEFVRMEWAIEILQACAESKYLCYLLTKRAECLPEVLRQWQLRYRVSEWPANVWLGFTAGNQKRFDERWAYFTDEADGVLGRFPDTNIFVSYEPALGPLVLPESFYNLRYGHKELNCCPGHFEFNGDCPACYKAITHIIPHKISGDRFLVAGGETGKNARPAHPQWFVNIKNQCLDKNVTFHLKQWGRYMPASPWMGHDFDMVGEWPMKKAPKHKNNHLLFGKAYGDTPLG